ncbi:4-hydroxy-tetrahydrodipicolinate reductase [Parabacteroides sp. OttesenSCG-928-G06]|nr:4-hydroxy-tetrahydrodipicolinate reductase [Parabacteroides sp. OttesenSCG-928-K15]MDL2282547.1 4-hydroxy-tetrahydrodipicolinate reductase [Parabacteroides sp. OttesenSCG-928-G06]
MKIALIGYGKMGKTIERIARERGHEIVSIIDIQNLDDFNSEAFKSADVAIEFTIPSTAYDNYMKSFAAGVPVVSGTTGWLDRLDDIKKKCAEEGKTFFYASNFSIGMNIFFALNRYLAKIMNGFPAYDVRMNETHHIHKLDAPSGTAITLAEDMMKEIDRKTTWCLDKVEKPEELLIEAFREGEVPGRHEVVYESEIDTIRIEHDAKNREGLAMGAVIAAEFTAGKQGFLTMKDLLTF